MRIDGEAHTVALSGRRVTCLIHRRKNQKYINLRISLDGEVIVSAPFGVSVARIKESLEKKERWITRHLTKAAENRAVNDPALRLLYRGRPLAVRAYRDPKRKRSVWINDTAQAIEVHTQEPTRKTVLTILEGFLMRQAKRQFTKRAQELAELTGIRYQKLFIRNQRTRWGSSSARGNLSVNWRAIMAPPPVQDYLLIHELAHQVHLDHSKAFWKVVERWCPDYEEANRWLKSHALLMSLFR